MDENKLVRIQNRPPNILQREPNFPLASQQQFIADRQLLLRRRPRQSGQVQIANLLRIIHLRIASYLRQHAAWLVPRRPANQLAVHERERLRDRPIERRRLIVLIRPKRLRELFDPPSFISSPRSFATVLSAFVAVISDSYSCSASICRK